MKEEKTAWDMPENTTLELLDKIIAMACEIRNDWRDPRGEFRKIVKLCEKLKQLSS